MLHLLTPSFLDIFNGESRHPFDERVVDNQIFEVFDEESKKLLVREIVATHLVEGLLRAKDIVY